MDIMKESLELIGEREEEGEEQVRWKQVIGCFHNKPQCVHQ